jgi:hypothetical protein
MAVKRLYRLWAPHAQENVRRVGGGAFCS